MVFRPVKQLSGPSRKVVLCNDSRTVIGGGDTAYAVGDDSGFAVWDSESGETLASRSLRPGKYPSPCTISGNGSVYACRRPDKSIGIWSTRPVKKISTLRFDQLIHGPFILNRDGTVFFYSEQRVPNFSGTYSVRVWSVPDKKEICQLDLEYGWMIHGLALSPDQKLLAACCGCLTPLHTYEFSLKIWEWQTKTTLRSVSSEQIVVPYHLTPKALSADGNALFLIGEMGVYYWQWRNEETFRTYLETPIRVSTLTLTSSGKYLVTGDKNGKIAFWDIAKAKIVHSFNHIGPVSSIAISDDNRTLVTNGGGVHIYKQCN